MPSLVNDLTHFCPVPSSERSRDAEVVPWTKDLHLLRIWGRFPPGWAGLLSLGLSHAQLAIVRGYARKVPQGHWLGEFQIRPLPGGPDPKQVDYVELALTGPANAEREPIVLQSYFVDRAPDHGGALFLEVRGEDRMGFLGSLLDGLAGGCRPKKRDARSTRCSKASPLGFAQLPLPHDLRPSQLALRASHRRCDLAVYSSGSRSSRCVMTRLHFCSPRELHTVSVSWRLPNGPLTSMVAKLRSWT